MNADAGPGVPEAIPRTLRLLGERLGVDAIDRVWIFPPLIRGRRESGLVAASCFHGEDGRRRVFTAPYRAERTGAGLTLDAAVEEQGEAPPDRLPRVMDGVVRRAGDELGEPREVEIGGEPSRWTELMDGFDPALLEETSP